MERIDSIFHLVQEITVEWGHCGFLAVPWVRAVLSTVGGGRVTLPYNVLSLAPHLFGLVFNHSENFSIVLACEPRLELNSQ